MIAVETVRKASQTWKREAGIDDATASTLQLSASRSRQSEGPSGFQVSKHVKNFAIVAGYYVVGCVFFCPVEGWSILKVRAPLAMIIHQRARARSSHPLRRARLAALRPSLSDTSVRSQTVYFTTVTITTVGYGDVAPATTEGKLFGVLFILFGLSVVFAIVANVALDVIEAAEARALHAADDDPTDNKKPHKTKIAISIAVLVLCVLAGTIFFWSTGPWMCEGRGDGARLSDEGPRARGCSSLEGEFDGKVIDAFWWCV